MPSLLNSVALHQYFLKSFWTTWSFCFLARKEKTLEELGIGIPQKYCDFCSRTLQWSKHFSKGNHLKFGFPEHMKVVFVQSTQSWETPGTTATPCPSVSFGVCSNSCPLSQLGHQTISSSVIPFFPHLQSSLASGSLPMSLLFTSSGQSIWTSALASVHPIIVRVDFL